MNNIQLTHQESCSIVNCINNMIIDIQKNKILTTAFKQESLQYYNNLINKYSKLEKEILKICIKEE